MIEALLIANSNLSNLQINDRAVYCHVITKFFRMGRFTYKTKEARLIFTVGNIYISFYQYFGRHGLPSLGSYT